MAVKINSFVSFTGYLGYLKTAGEPITVEAFQNQVLIQRYMDWLSVSLSIIILSCIITIKAFRAQIRMHRDPTLKCIYIQSEVYACAEREFKMADNYGVTERTICPRSQPFPKFCYVDSDELILLLSHSRYGVSLCSIFDCQSNEILLKLGTDEIASFVVVGNIQ